MTVRVLHLVGSAVSEFYVELSCLYARDCLEATADPQRYDFVIAYVTPDRCWRFPPDLDPASIAAAAPVPIAAALAHIATLGVDVVVPQMFCLEGMTAYRALFDVLAIPYVGNSATVMGIGADKALARAVVSAAGVDVPAGQVVRAGEPVDVVPPAVVKPVDADNSLGVTLVGTRAGYDDALRAAFEHSDRVLVEDYVELGREVRCAVLELGGRLVCLPLEEYRVDTATKPIRPYDDKIARVDAGAGDGALRLLAKNSPRSWIVDPADPITAAVWAAARSCHRALGCRDYSLFDFRIDPAGRPWFLEAGLYCSFARQSVVAVMAQASGRDLPTLFADMVVQACARRAVGR